MTGVVWYFARTRVISIITINTYNYFVLSHQIPLGVFS